MLAMAIAGDGLGAFRTAQELNSSETAQLKRTVQDLEELIRSKDALIATQLQAIEQLESSGPKPQQKTEPGAQPSNLELLEEIAKLREKNRKMETILEDLQEGFESLYNAQMEAVETGLKTLNDLPASEQASALYTRIHKQSGAISRARQAGHISPINALRQMADLQQELSDYLVGRPLLTFSRSERYRAGVLLAAMEREGKAISTPEAIRILSENEGKQIAHPQAIRAMRFLASNRPDKVQFQHKGPRRKAWLCKINSKGGSSN